MLLKQRSLQIFSCGQIDVQSINVKPNTTSLAIATVPFIANFEQIFTHFVWNLLHYCNTNQTEFNNTDKVICGAFIEIMCKFFIDNRNMFFLKKQPLIRKLVWKNKQE